MRSAAFVTAVLVAAAVLTTALPAGAAERPREVPYGQLHGPDDEIFMQVKATPEEISGVRRAIEHSSLVARFAFLDQQSAFEEFRRIFRKEPDLVAHVDATSLPTSFRIELRNHDDRMRFRTRFDRLDGVDVVEAPLTKAERTASERRKAALAERCGQTAPVEVFLTVKATAADEAAVEAALQAMPDVVGVHEVTRSEAKTVFDCLFADDPHLTKSVDPDSLPVSFRLAVRPGADVRALASSAELLHGVDEAVLKK
jgi:cell division protein FtsX